MRQRERLAEARRRGKQVGLNAASWVFDGNTTDAYRAKVQQCIADGDPANPVQEPGWLSGEWAGESVSELLGDLLWPCTDRKHETPCQQPCAACAHECECDDKNDEIETAYEIAASEAFWTEVGRGAALRLDGEA